MIVTWVAHSKSTAVRPGISWQYPLTGPWNSSTDPIPPCLLPAPPYPLLSSVGSQIRFRTPQSRTCTLACAWLALIQAARSNSYLESLVMLETCRAGSVPLMGRTRTGRRKECGQVFPETQNTPTAWTDSAWGTSGHRRQAAVLKPLICLTAGGSQKEIVELYLPDILLSCSFCDSKASLAKQRNSCYSGKKPTAWQPSAFCYNITTSYKSSVSELLLYFGHTLSIWDTALYYLGYGDTLRCVTTPVFCHKIFICRLTTNITSDFEKHFL